VALPVEVGVGVAAAAVAKKIKEFNLCLYLNFQKMKVQKILKVIIFINYFFAKSI
jgi:hypothetical protein